ncbi:uncharacterized protein LOC105426488 isoform X3 [Pogonomyrmex barbatus]|uniref:Uncharacterized protein LOC105426488 isoform X3 n=1 Tax=Pogonomyrmex barbatus TaxID=144034 RepID=A0A6I9W6Y2_9HYME|nr:uncharacterized protein LOC105426488 isoform X3 [Pogonomyrmex barbatus]
MNASGVRVKIYDGEKCIHEHEATRSNGDDLKTLMQNLRDMQSNVNDFLTVLVQQRDASGGAQSNSIAQTASQSISSDSDSIEEDGEEDDKTEANETQTNPKK